MFEKKVGDETWIGTRSMINISSVDTWYMSDHFRTETSMPFPLKEDLKPPRHNSGDNGFLAMHVIHNFYYVYLRCKGVVNFTLTNIIYFLTVLQTIFVSKSF